MLENFSHWLDSDVWTTKDNQKLHPANGEMTEKHIRNAIAYMCTTERLTTSKKYDRTVYQCLSISLYLELRVKRSKLWKALHEGLEYHENLKNNNRLP